MIAIDGHPISPRGALDGTRWLVVDSQPQSRAQAIARELRAAGCHVRRVDVVGLQLARLSAFDAQLVLIDDGQDMRFLQERIGSHAGLRWANILRTAWPALWHDGSAKPDLEALARHALPLLEPDRALHELARGTGDLFEVPSEPLGPIRALRAVCMANDVFRVTFANEGAQGHVELAGKLLLGAWFQRGTDPMLMGAEALAGAIDMDSALVTVRRKVRPKAPWFVKPLDEALELALHSIRERRLGEHDDSPTMRIAPELIAEAVGDEALDPESEATRIMVVPSTPAPGVQTPSTHTPSAQALSAHTLSAHTPSASTPIPSLPPARSGGLPRLSMPAALGALAVLGLLAAGLSLMRSSAPTSAVTPGRASSQAEASVAPGAGAVLRTPIISKSQASAGAVIGRAAPKPSTAPLPTKRSPKAATPTARLTDLQSRNITGLAARAKSALLSRDLVSARALAERAITLRPRRAEFRLLYGDVLAASDRHQEALAQYREGLRLRPQSRTLQQRLARVKAAQAQY